MPCRRVGSKAKGLCPSYGHRPNQGRSPTFERAAGEAEPRLTSGGEAGRRSLSICAKPTTTMKKLDAATQQTSSRLRELTNELHQLEARLRLGGGPEKIDRQHQQGKLTARERIEKLLDKDAYAQEVGLLVAYDRYDGGAPAAGVVTVVGRV